MTLTPYQHRSAQGRAGEALGRFDPAHTSVGNQSQFRCAPAPVGRPCSLLPLTPPLTCAGSFAKIGFRHIFNSHSAWCSLTPRSRLPPLRLQAGLSGRVNCRGYSARTLRFDVAHHVCQDNSDTPHRHSSSTSSLSHEHDPSDGAITRVQKAFAFGANEHE